MAITIDYPTKVISVQRVDMILIQSTPTFIHELDLVAFRGIIKAFTDDEQGITYDESHEWFPIQVLDGVPYAPLLKMINGYTVTFENLQGAVRLRGANTNLDAVTNVNQVSVRPANSAGLTSTLEIPLILKILKNRKYINPVDGLVTIFDDDDTTVLLSGIAYEDLGGLQTYQGQGADRQDRLT